MGEANAYTLGHHESVLAAHRWRTIANSAAYLEPELVRGRTLLDVGCGPGTVTVEFGARLGDDNVIGVDMADAAIAAARAMAAETGSAVRFDVAYHGLFKCNWRRYADFPNLQAHLERFYALPNVAETVRFDHIKRGYYSVRALNPSGIVPVGPIVPFLDR